MSFILDALKKSEAERQRQAGPTLLELRIPQPRRRYPLWTLWVGGLLLANILVLLAFLLRRPPSVPELAAGAPTSAQHAVQTTATPPSAPPVVSGTSLPSATPEAPTAAVVPAASSAVASAQASGPPAVGPDNRTGPTSARVNPADYEPAVAVAPADPVPSPQTVLDYSALPSLADLGGNLPALQLDLLDYSDQANERYALINMHRVHEGDVLPEGAHVLAITRDGVALDYRGRDFMLRPGGTP